MLRTNYFLLFFPLISLAATLTATAAPPIKVMSFNIRFDGTAGEASEQENAWIAKNEINRRDLAISVVTDYAPDILGVQEALKNQIDDFMSALKYHDCYAIGRDDGGEQGEHCGIFYDKRRFVRLDQGTYWLTQTPNKPGSKYPDTCCARIATWVVLKDLQAGDREYFVLNTHWDHVVKDARLFSAQLIRKRLGAQAKGRPVVVLGDLNTTPGSSAYCCLTTAPLRGDIPLIDSYCNQPEKQKEPEGTYHSFGNLPVPPRIDYIFHSPEFCSSTPQIIRTRDNQRYPSDHFPITAILIPLNR